MNVLERLIRDGYPIEQILTAAHFLEKGAVTCEFCETFRLPASENSLPYFTLSCSLMILHTAYRHPAEVAAKRQNPEALAREMWETLERLKSNLKGAPDDWRGIFQRIASAMDPAPIMMELRK